MIEFILGLFGQGGNLITQYADVALSVVGTFALIASRTPNTVDDKISQFFMDVINFLGANLGAAKNAK